MAASIIMEAFENLDKEVRLQKIYLGVLTHTGEKDFSSDHMPDLVERLDESGRISSLWLRLSVEDRKQFYEKLVGLLKEHGVSEKLKSLIQFQLIYWNGVLRSREAEVKSEQPSLESTGLSFPEKWNDLGVRQRWEEAMTDEQRKEILSLVDIRKKPTRSYVDSLFDRVLNPDLPPVQPKSEEDETSDEIAEVLGVALKPRTKLGKLVINVRHTNGSSRWVNAENVLAPFVCDQLRSELVTLR